MKDYAAPSIKVIKNAFPQADLFLEKALSAPEEAWVGSEIDGNVYLPEFRKSSELPIPHGLMYPRVFYDLAYIIHEQASIYAKENGFEFTHMENLSLVKYRPNQDFFDRHNDDGPNQPRSISIILYINDVEEGGETYFDKFDLTITPEKGKLVIFPSNFPYSHQAFPPISGEKYCIVTFFGQQLSKDIFERYYPKYAPHDQ